MCLNHSEFKLHVRLKYNRDWYFILNFSGKKLLIQDLNLLINLSADESDFLKFAPMHHVLETETSLGIIFFGSNSIYIHICTSQAKIAA